MTAAAAVAAWAFRWAAAGSAIGTLIVLGLVSYAFGIDPRILIGGAEILTGGGGSSQAPSYQTGSHVAPPRPARRPTKWAT